MKKKVLIAIMVMLLCFTYAACGGNEAKDGSSDSSAAVTEEQNDGIDPNATLTKEKYEQLRKDKWNEMTPKEMEKYLGVKYVEDKEATEERGEGYLEVDFPGPDETSYLHVLFKDKGDGKMTPASMSASGQLMGE